MSSLQYLKARVNLLMAILIKLKLYDIQFILLSFISQTISAKIYLIPGAREVLGVALSK